MQVPLEGGTPNKARDHASPPAGNASGLAGPIRESTRGQAVFNLRQVV